MTIQECYQQLGGDFAQVEKRLQSVSLVKGFLAKFLNDRSYSELYLAMKEGQSEKAFRAAHTLKGVCANLGLTKLLSSASRLSELLQADGESIPPGADLLLDEIKKDYDLTISAIRAYLATEN